jgi:hypothetical protein
MRMRSPKKGFLLLLRRNCEEKILTLLLFVIRFYRIEKQQLPSVFMLIKSRDVDLLMAVFERQPSTSRPQITLAAINSAMRENP